MYSRNVDVIVKGAARLSVAQKGGGAKHFFLTLMEGRGEEIGCGVKKKIPSDSNAASSRERGNLSYPSVVALGVRGGGGERKEEKYLKQRMRRKSERSEEVGTPPTRPQDSPLLTRRGRGGGGERGRVVRVSTSRSRH